VKHWCCFQSSYSTKLAVASWSYRADVGCMCTTIRMVLASLCQWGRWIVDSVSCVRLLLFALTNRRRGCAQLFFNHVLIYRSICAFHNCTHTHTRTCMHVRIHTCIHPHVHTYTFKHNYKQARMYTYQNHSHTQVLHRFYVTRTCIGFYYLQRLSAYYRYWSSMVRIFLLSYSLAGPNKVCFPIQ
jgi:hypothetical protein